jgi:hypothetical protein
MLLPILWSIITSTGRTFYFYAYVVSVLNLFVTHGPKIFSWSKSTVFVERQATLCAIIIYLHTKFRILIQAINIKHYFRVQAWIFRSYASSTLHRIDRNR